MDVLQEFEKKIKALEKSPNALISHKRHLKLTDFLRDHFSVDSSKYEQLKQRVYDAHALALKSMV